MTLKYKQVTGECWLGTKSSHKLLLEWLKGCSVGKRNFFSTGHWAQLGFFLTKGTSGPPFKYTYLSYVFYVKQAAWTQIYCSKLKWCQVTAEKLALCIGI